jgi:hypothetical protein
MVVELLLTHHTGDRLFDEGFANLNRIYNAIDKITLSRWVASDVGSP